MENKRWCVYIHTNKINGKKLSDETRKKMSESRKGLKRKEEVNKKTSKAVIQYDLNNKMINKFYGVRKASKETNINGSSISLVCRHKRKSAGGYIWRYEKES